MTVAGPNAVPSGHPDNDLLADLAAQVLPPDLAGQVQHHVQTCGRCTALLTDAESVRSLLLQIEPEVMPVEVLTRLERSLAMARQQERPTGPPSRSGNPFPDSGETVMLNRVPGAEPPPRKDTGRRIVRSGPATGRMAATGGGGPMTGRLNRMSQSTTSARRQAIEEQKADRPSRLEQFAPVLKIAAGILVVAGVGVVGLQAFNHFSSGSDATTSAADSGASAPVLTPVLSTKTKYDKGDLAGQVKKLITASQSEATKPQALAQESDDASSRAAAPKASGADASKAPNQLLRDPGALRACLKDIGAGNAQPVAIDLARYAETATGAFREAAIIVLPGDGGGYDVWVVARDCKPGSDGAIDVVNVKS